MTYFMYKGKEYTSLEAMPPDVRNAYTKWRQEQNLPDDLLEFYEEELRLTEAQNRGELPLPSAKTAPTEHRLELLPSTCPKCGGPVHGDNVKWTGAQSADCPYCGLNLPMRTEPGAAAPR
jgi:hypothetical protein